MKTTCLLLLGTVAIAASAPKGQGETDQQDHSQDQEGNVFATAFQIVGPFGDQNEAESYVSDNVSDDVRWITAELIDPSEAKDRTAHLAGVEREPAPVA